MKFLLTLFCALFSMSAFASGRITASITITNATTNGMTFTVNSDVRTFTNVVFQSTSQVLTNADATGCGSKTNLYLQIGLNLFSQLAPVDTGSNTFQLSGPCGDNFSVTMATGLGIVTYSTQVCATATPMGIPFSAYYPNPLSGTNVASQFTLDLQNYDTNQISQTSTFAGQLLGTAKGQTATGTNNFTSRSNMWGGMVVGSPSIGGTVSNLTGGLWSSGILNNPTSTNLVNFGNAISSPGTGLLTEQFGNGATATANNATALGGDSAASGNSSTALGNASIASGPSATAVGTGATASNTGTAVGASALASVTNATALGAFTTASFINSTAVGFGATVTAVNQVMLGSATVNTVVSSGLAVGANASITSNLVVSGNASITGMQSNNTFVGFNTFTNTSDVAFVRFPVSSLANGNNAAVPIGTNEFIEVSGPSGSFTINGMANGRDGKLITVLNQTGFQMTIANESGTDPTAANRIRTLGAALDLVFTNAACTFQYNGNVSRWILISHNP